MGKSPDPELPEEARKLLARLRTAPPPVKLSEEERDALLARPGQRRTNIETLLSLEATDDPA